MLVIIDGKTPINLYTH